MNIESIFNAVTNAVEQLAAVYWSEPVGRCGICNSEISRGEYTILERYDFQEGCFKELFTAKARLDALESAPTLEEPPPAVEERIADDVGRPARVGLNEPRRGIPRVRNAGAPQAPRVRS